MQYKNGKIYSQDTLTVEQANGVYERFVENNVYILPNEKCGRKGNKRQPVIYSKDVIAVEKRPEKVENTTVVEPVVSASTQNIGAELLHNNTPVAQVPASSEAKAFVQAFSAEPKKGKKQASIPKPEPEKSGKPFWFWPVVVTGGVLVLLLGIFFLTTLKKK